MFLRLFLATLALAVVSGCGDPICETGEEASCVLPSPCEDVRFDDCGGFTRIRILAAGDSVPLGDDALASPGDFLLQNDRFALVIDGLGHPHYLAASGGAMLDAVADGTDADSLVQIAQSVGLGADDSVVYDRYRILETDDGAALQVRGTLVSNEDHKVLTRYEIRSCEPGVRVRTEVYNRGAEPVDWSLADLWLHGERGHLPFAPGLTRKALDEPTPLSPEPIEISLLSTIPSTPGETVYGCVPCSAPRLSGFVRSDVSMLGAPERTVAPGDREIFERFIIIAGGGDAAGAADIAYELRRQLFGNSFRTVVGQVSASGVGSLGDETRATVVVEGVSGERSDAPVALTQVTPGGDGRFEARVPAGEDLDVVSLAFGREVDRESVASSDDELDAGTLSAGAAGTIRISTTVDGAPGPALVAILPADEATRTATQARRWGAGPLCAPLLGAPHGDGPACSRLVVTSSAEVLVPEGVYRVVTTHGPFATLAETIVTIVDGDSVDADLSITTLPMLSEGTRSVDLHAHGPASFDASASVASRVAALSALGLDVVAMTDHDVLVDYASAAEGSGITVLTGLETTAQRPYPLFDDGPSETIGRFSFVPLMPVATGPWRGAPADEGVEPGVLFTRVSSAGFDLDLGLVQLLRPWGQPILGRHVGFPRAIGLDARRTLPTELDGTARGLFRRTPAGARFANDAFHTIEILSGVEPESYVAQRALWYYLLAENVVRPVTGGGGSHGIGEAVPGSPRTLVQTTSTELADLFAALREGRSLATNGPVIEVTMLDDTGAPHSPSTTPFTINASPTVSIRVLAAPWVPVDEVRVVVNGEVLTTLTDELSTPSDPLGTDGLLRYEGTIDITPGLAFEFGDAFVVVEAGAALPSAADLDCDGIPETGDNDGNGVIDAADIGIRAAPNTPAPPVRTIDTDCVAEAGPLRRASPPTDPSNRRHIFEALMGFAPTATSNPLLLDVDGGGYDGVPLGLMP